MARTNLYDDGKEYFKLRSDSSYAFYINEPVGFDDVRGKLTRDKDYLTFTAEMISADKDLLFSNEQVEGERPGGGQWIRQQIELTGPDKTNIYFEFGTQDNGVETALFYGRLNLYGYDGGNLGERPGVTTTIERVDFENTLRTRWETPIRIWSPFSLDDNIIAFGEDILPLKMHSKQIIKLAETDDQQGRSARLVLNDVTPDPPYVASIIPSGQSITKEEATTIAGNEFGVLSGTPEASQLYQFKADEQGRLEMWFNVEFDISAISSNQTAAGANTYIAVEMKRYNAAGDLKDQQTGQNVTNDFFLDTPVNFDGSDYFQTFCEVGDRVYVYVLILHEDNDSVGPIDAPTINIGNGVASRPFRHNLKFKHWTQMPKTDCVVYNWWEVIKYMVNSITGYENRVISNFFGPTGAGHLYALTNGFNLREFPSGIIKISMKDIIQAMQSIFCIGVGYRTVAGLDYLVLEPAGNFYRKAGVPIFKVDNLISYRNLINKEAYFNEVEIGYDKYADDGLNSLDDYNTIHRLLMPLKNIKATKQVKCPFITSPYLIEQTRREYYAENSTGSKPNDDSIFLISYREQTIYGGPITYNAAGTDIEFTNKELGMVRGDTFLLFDGGLNDGTLFTVQGKVLLNPEQYEVLPVPVAGSDTATSILMEAYVGDFNFPERNENFETASGIYSPGTAYNLRTSIKHMTYEWSPIFNIPMFYNEGTENIKVTDFKNNGDLKTKFKSYDPFQLKAGIQFLTEKAQIVLSNYNGKVGLYSPDSAEISCPLSYQDYAMFRSAVRGELPSGDQRNYSYIQHIDDKGVIWNSFVEDMEYDFKKQRATIIVNKIEKVG